MAPGEPDHPDHRAAAESALGSPDPRKRTRSLFRRVYAVLLLRNAAVTVSECFAIYDESVSAFFGGASGLVVVGAVWLVQMTLAASASAPDPALDRQRLVGIVALECVVHAGAAANVYHSYDMRLSDILAANAALGVFQLGHVLFFFNPWLDYNALYGVGYGVACATGCALFDWQDSGGLSWSTAGAGFAFVCCVWYALETHAFAARAADGRAGCCSVVLCFAYADAWNAASKCGGAKSSGATTASEQLAA